ncbi:hypothetical protein ACIQ6K_19265 [Streptomyces sp. NPDC096354]|uniref:hypothetical protein n=1 Tax=Streptomyces sp. NPDC096354 TaxID=3366088 RepID=UPI0037F29F6B
MGIIKRGSIGSSIAFAVPAGSEGAPAEAQSSALVSSDDPETTPTDPTALRPARGLAVLAAAVALCVSGCTEDGRPTSHPPASPSAQPSPSKTSDRAEHIEGETVSRAPTQVNDRQVLLSVASRKGNAELPLTKEIGVGRLVIQVNCQGDGTIEVSVEPVGLSFPLECVVQEVSSTYNEIILKRARSEGSVRVEAPSGVRWALTAEQ